MGLRSSNLKDPYLLKYLSSRGAPSKIDNKWKTLAQTLIQVQSIVAQTAGTQGQLHSSYMAQAWLHVPQIRLLETEGI